MEDKQLNTYIFDIHTNKIAVVPAESLCFVAGSFFHFHLQLFKIKLIDIINLNVYVCLVSTIFLLIRNPYLTNSQLFFSQHYYFYVVKYVM